MVRVYESNLSVHVKYVVVTIDNLEFQGFDDSEPGDDEEEKELTLDPKIKSGTDTS